VAGCWREYGEIASLCGAQKRGLRGVLLPFVRKRRAHRSLRMMRAYFSVRAYRMGA
jgi:hypothetical protein